MPAVPLRNTHDRFGLVAQALHWAMAGLIVVLVPLGVYMHELPLSPRKLELYGLHKSLGMTLLGLAVLRILWRLMDPPPPPVAGAPAWQNRAAGAVHLALYGLMVAMPLSGWIMSSAANFPVSVFGLFTAPNLVGPDKGLEDLAKGVHFALGLALVGLVVLHLAAAIKHQVVDRDGLLARMVPGRSRVPAWLALAVGLAGALAAAAPAAAEPWTAVDPAASRIGFTARQMGADFDGRFGAFTAQFRFDPADLAASRVVIDLDVATVATDNAERDALLTGADWFHADAHPRARFESATFTATGPGAYRATGRLTLRGVTRDVTTAFTVAPDGATALFSGDLTVKRTDFGVGQGQWSDTAVIGDPVTIRYRLLAR